MMKYYTFNPAAILTSLNADALKPQLQIINKLVGFTVKSVTNNRFHEYWF